LRQSPDTWQQSLLVQQNKLALEFRRRLISKTTLFAAAFWLAA
jgi:hypothetical protein